MTRDDEAATGNDRFDRRGLLKRGTVAGALAFGGWTVSDASARGGQETTTAADGQETTPADGQETTTAPAGAGGAFSQSLQQGDQFRVRFRPRDPAGNPATETVPAACLGTEQDEEFQLFIVRAFRDGRNIGFRGLLLPIERVETETPETETATAAETTPAEERARVALGRWYRVTASEPCDGLNSLALERTQPPETTALGTETTTE